MREIIILAIGAMAGAGVGAILTAICAGGRKTSPCDYCDIMLDEAADKSYCLDCGLVKKAV